ncbi:MAG: TolC family protein [bacterium]
MNFKLVIFMTGMILGIGTWLQAAEEVVRGITLERCIQTALEASPDVQSANARLSASSAAVKEASSAYYPQVGLSGSWTRTDNPPQAFFMSLNQRRASLQKDFNHPDDTENVRGSVAAQWRVFDSGRREADRKAARQGAKASEFMLESVQNDLVYQITRAYYGILQVRAFVAVQEEAVESLSESLRVATERNLAGSDMKTDVLNLDVQLSQAREELIRAKNGLKLGVAALNTAIGRTLIGPADVVDMKGGEVPAASTNEVNGGVEERPELRAMEARVRAMEAMVARARREYLPVVNGMGSFDWDSETLSGFEQSYLVGVAVEVNIFDGQRNRAGVTKARAAAAEIQAEAEKLRQTLELDLTQARLNEQEARERLEVAAKSQTSAEEALRITQERYQQGAAVITELLTAQIGLTATRTRQVAAQYDCLIARANVERAMGRK